MFLYTRIATIAPGKLRPAHAFIADVTGHIRETASLDVMVWTPLFGRPVGTVAWTLVVDSMAGFLDATAALSSSNAYLDKAAGARDLFVAPAEDFLREIVHVAGEFSTDFDHATSTSAVIADRFAETMAWSIEMADFAHEATGRSTWLMRDVFGAFGGVVWLSGVNGSAEVEAAGAALRDSGDYLARLDKATGMFIPGSVRRSLVRRLL